MVPPSTATHTLWTLILPVCRLSETSTTPAPSEPERSGDREAERAAGRTRRLPVAHLRHGLEALAGLGRGAHALEPELDRIHVRVDRHLVDEAFDGEDVEHVRHGAPVLDLHAVRDAAQLELLVGHAVVGDPHAAGQQHVAAVADHAVLPAGDLAGAVERRLQALERLRAEPALRQVLLARPDQLDRTLHLAGDQRDLDRLHAAVAPAEAAAEVALVVGRPALP